MNKVLITGEDLTLDEIVSVCRGNAQVEISQEAREKGTGVQTGGGRFNCRGEGSLRHYYWIWQNSATW